MYIHSSIIFYARCYWLLKNRFPSRREMAEGWTKNVSRRGGKSLGRGISRHTPFPLEFRKLVANFLSKSEMEARKVNLALISCRFERVSGAGLWTEFNPRRWCIPSDDGSMENVSLTPLTLYFLGLNDFCSLTGYSFKNHDHLSFPLSFEMNSYSYF